MADATRVTSHTVAVGPWGGPDGDAWDDGIYTGIQKITLKAGRTVDAIQVTYDVNGKPCPGPWHGGPGGETVEIEFDRDEYIQEVRGYTNKYEGHIIVRSLTFKTDKQTYGPFGEQEGTPFNLPIKEGIIVGCHGRAGTYLDALGYRLSL